MMTESQLSARVSKFVHVVTFYGGRGYHTHRSDKSQRGFPDWQIVVPGHSYAIELKGRQKAGYGKPTADQIAWLNLFHSVPNCTAALVYPWEWEPLEDDILKRIGLTANPLGRFWRS